MICTKTMRDCVGQWSHVKQWQKFGTETLKKCEEMASRNIFRHFFARLFFMFVLVISDHTVFLVQFEINFALVSFSKSWNCTRRSGTCNFSFLKNSLVQIYSKLNSKPMQTTLLNVTCNYFLEFSGKFWCLQFSQVIEVWNCIVTFDGALGKFVFS